MEETLRDLQQAMVEHRKALAETRVPRGEPAPVKRDGVDPRQILMQRLAADIERISGIEITGMMETKLSRVLVSVNLAALEAWVGQLHLLPPDDPEWLSLIETLTVHETFFHRDRAQIELLSQVLPQLIEQAVRERRHTLRLWSAGCATGEEAYTVAIQTLLALRDAGFADESLSDGIVCRPPWTIDILGTDISRLVLTRARAAVYSDEGLSPFRELPRGLQRFFPLLPAANEAGSAAVHGVLPAITERVRFEHFNLMSPSPPETGFDIVLCRNVLIYMTAPARLAVQSRFREALRPGGYLFLGPTDALAEPAHYTARWGTGAVAYRLKPADA